MRRRFHGFGSVALRGFGFEVVVFEILWASVLRVRMCELLSLDGVCRQGCPFCSARAFEAMRNAQSSVLETLACYRESALEIKTLNPHTKLNQLNPKP